ncbi:DNA-directed RNA polymerase subunit omega [Bdellovibrio bacteriovorus]|uniref:DNA-directed RNA polymerase subunit omega n=2 Tax=Bdellovibrio bacteriovorus TaxID=959 RepID=RPOZ_BDEBA|nr:DNA-directed RNA polymerase subunit omega [Bdellovibrio bacteriovorus]Q6MMQ7.1 RecName: Full=DNA-directed RNA polymerase subunit omega; Short=RNAP omega subunit; AltName: Full=RNA polymerase omega subunit; AltName: Full=Transcriptase subunit omega [Bdellovibrio bacteriovorus HD100]AHZ84118.1 DNA-directed RNA polymerase subunit omega [Bdellovibrio bacteriovorus]ASD64058.1 DNA-directed RNA polymerase subunit omega [Bdellovibrio bacteriovorus]CAE79447.1 putative DNA-directed RNA polymerase, ome
MARVTVEDCLEKVPNRFALVLMVAKRAKQLLKGAEATVSTRSNKYIVSSLREVAMGNVGYQDSLDANEAIRQIEKDLNK